MSANAAERSEAGAASAPVVAVLPAGGSGTRLGSALPKQLIKIDGREILAHTLDVFEAVAEVDEIFVLPPAEHVPAVEALVKAHGFGKVRGVTPGGGDRAASVRAGIAALSDHDGDTKVLVHDAVRPLVDTATVSACVTALDDLDAVTVAVAATDTVLEVATKNGREVITGIPDRTRLRRCQTPQAFRLRVLAKAHRLAAADPDFTPTDDCGVVRRYLPDMAIGIVPGSEANLKITYSSDLRFAADLLRDRTL